MAIKDEEDLNYNENKILDEGKEALDNEDVISYTHIKLYLM